MKDFLSPQTYYLLCGFFSGILGCYIIARMFFNNSLAKQQANFRISQEQLLHAEETIIKQQELISNLTHQLKDKDALLTNHFEKQATLREQNATLQAELSATKALTASQEELIAQSKKELAESFKAISSELITSNNHSFLSLANESLIKLHHKTNTEQEKRALVLNELFNPIKDSLNKVDTQIRQVEKDRVGAYNSLTEQVKYLLNSHTKLQHETTNLSRALRNPTVRGRWGEIQLRRVVELAGMIEYCDFIEQKSITTDSGEILRPDLIIKLPNNKEIIVDSKAVIQSYLQAQESVSDKDRLMYLKKHARHVRDHLSQLATKSYWQQFPNSPEFVVLFLPGENFFSAALEQDPEIIELGATQKVIIATPTTLIALLRAVSYGWRQENLAKNAQEIGELGKTLYDRLHVLADHFKDLKKGLDRTIQSFNNAVGSYEGRVMVTARKLTELDPLLEKKEEPLQTVDLAPRSAIDFNKTNTS